MFLAFSILGYVGILLSDHLFIMHKVVTSFINWMVRIILWVDFRAGNLLGRAQTGMCHWNLIVLVFLSLPFGSELGLRLPSWSWVSAGIHWNSVITLLKLPPPKTLFADQVRIISRGTWKIPYVAERALRKWLKNSPSSGRYFPGKKTLFSHFVLS